MSDEEGNVQRPSIVSEAEEDPFACFDDDSDSSIDDEEDEHENSKVANAAIINSSIQNSRSRSKNNNTETDEDSDDENTDDGNSSHTPAPEDGTSRDRTCGILSFHDKTESALLYHVRNVMSENTKIAKAASGATTSATLSAADRVLSSVDEFCQNRHWMMHIGPEKGNDILIKQGLEKSLQTYLLEYVTKGVQATEVVHEQGNIAQEDQQQKMKADPFIAVEMGTYCGYSSILLAKNLKEAVKEYGIEGHVYSVEIDPHCAQVANEMIRMAELQKFITVVLIGDNQDDKNSSDEEDENDEETNTMMPGGSEDVSVKILQESVLPPNCKKIDFLFLDHDKFLYLPSFLAFQRANLLQRGTLVVADNVLFAGIMDYVSYVRELKKQGVVQTKTIESRIEYWTERELLEAGEDTLRDGVGEYIFM